MKSSELPKIPGLIRLQNPETGGEPTLDHQYTLRDAAAIHLQGIRTHLSKISVTEPILIIGMSMGGMIMSYLASEFRKELPKNTRFRFLATSANLPTQPVISDELIRFWQTAIPGDSKSFAPILKPFFSLAYVSQFPDQFRDYCAFRANGANQQTPRGFMRQVGAIKSFPGAETFAAVDPSECEFIGAGDDQVLGKSHSHILQDLVPGAFHCELPGVGHMINMERPDLFHRELIGITT